MNFSKKRKKKKMPNWCLNTLEIQGPIEDVDKFMEKIKSAEPDKLSLFNALIPMPAEYSGEPASMTKEEKDWSDNEKLCFEKYGHKDWYSWCVANWGTKWNAYNLSNEGENKISFDTAWSTPAQVIERLSEMFPHIEIALEFADEDFGFNCGKVVFLAGNVIEENIPEGGSAEAYVIAAKTQGGDIDDLMFRICDSENSEFIETMINTAIDIYNVETLMYFVEEEETDVFSETFLETLKGVLIHIEAYEHIGKVDEMINQKVGEE